MSVLILHLPDSLESITGFGLASDDQWTGGIFIQTILCVSLIAACIGVIIKICSIAAARVKEMAAQKRISSVATSASGY